MAKLHHRLVFVSGIITALTVFVLVSLPVQGANKKDIDRMIEQTRGKLSRMIRREKSAMSSLVTTQKELDRVEGKLNKINLDLGVAHTKLLGIEDQIHNTEQQLVTLKKERDLRREQLNDRIVALYKYGLSSHLEVLAQANNFSDFINRFELVSLFVRRDMAVLGLLDQKCNDINQQKQILNMRHEDLQREKERIDQLKLTHAATRSQLRGTMNMKEAELAKIQGNRKELEKALDALERTSREMESRIRDYQENRSGPALGTGRLAWPCSGRITSPFGWRFHPVLHKQKFHSGIDISAGMGTPVCAADSGVVIVSGWNGGYGKMVVIDHGNRISTLYGHNSVLRVSVGDRVTQGQVIALSGSTGLSTGPHVHFEVRVDGRPVNPLSHL
ncbi:MAG TPA: peptidoglycan DD-metalloendopeptidase family protein [Bacillota bacterium]|nr:peptidoglycan DD-metalloendopeptidase family protein [Bacillota bacterium]